MHVVANSGNAKYSNPEKATWLKDRKIATQIISLAYLVKINAIGAAW